jgi:UPF0755 protein
VLPIVNRKVLLIAGTLFFGAFLILFFYIFLRPAAADTAPNQIFEVKSREGFREISAALGSAGLVRAPKVFEVYLILSGNATRLKPGEYELSPRMPSWSIAESLRAGPDNQVKIAIPEGSSTFEIDKLLADGGVIKQGELIVLAKNSHGGLEGKLFPDTYIFYKNSGAEAAAKKMLDNFNAKAAPILSRSSSFQKNLVLASILEKEVPSFEERRIVAGILLKRISSGVPLQVDATLCYMKKLAGDERCYPITQSDLKQDSPYNTYLYPSWPAGAISNPGLPAIQAALSPEITPYWFYLSDPASGKTIFSDTLDTHKANRVKYLSNS